MLRASLQNLSYKEKVFYGLLAGSLFCTASFSPAVAQSTPPTTFQITELPLPVNLTGIQKGEQVTLNFCGLLQSPNLQDILAYCYGNVTTSDTQMEKAWMQLLSTNDNKLSWLRDQPFVFPYDISSGRQLEALDNAHQLINSEQRSGLGYVPLTQKDLSILNRALTYNAISPQVPIYKKNSVEEYFDPQSVVLTEGGSLFVLKLDHVANKDTVNENYHLTQFDPMNKPVWQTSFKQGVTAGMIAAVEDQRDRLQLSQPDEKRDSQYEEFIQNGRWLSRSSLAQPTLIVSPKGQSFLYFGATQYDVAQPKAPDENSLGTKLYCVSPDGKSKFEDFIPGEFFSRQAAAFSPEGNILLLDDANDNKTQIIFNLLVFNPQCALAQKPLIQKQQLIIPIKDQTKFTTEILQVKTTSTGDIIVVYLEKSANMGEDVLLPYQLNMALFSKDGKLKAAKPIIIADQPAAWYLHPLPPKDYIFPAQRQLSVDLKIGTDDHSAFISIFNPIALDERSKEFGFTENVMGQNALIQGVEYKIQPKFFKITW